MGVDDIDMMARHWAKVLDSIGASAPEIALSLSLHSRHGKACLVTDFQVPPGYKSLLPAFIRRAGKSGIGFTARKAGEYRINAYNFDNEP